MDTVTIEEFQLLDIRIGTVIKAEVPEWSHWVMKLSVDLGEAPDGASLRTIFSGIMKFYKPEDLEGKQFPFIVNLKPRPMGPEKELSEGMMMMAVPSEDEDVAPVLFQLQKKVDNGTKVR